MGITLAELALLDTDVLKKGIMNTIVKENPILDKIPWMEIKGNSLLYNVETALPGISWIQATGTITDSAPQLSQRSTALKIAIGDIDIPKFNIATNSTQDVAGSLMEKKAKAFSYELVEQLLWGGTSTSNPTNAIKGLVQLIAELESEATVDLDGLVNDQVMPAHATSAVLTLDMLDELIDRVKPGKPDLLVMSRRMRRKLNSLSRASGTTLQTTTNDWGKFIDIYDGIQIGVHDHLLDNIQDGVTSVLAIADYDKTVTRAAGYDNSIIFAVKFGDSAFTGLQNGGMQREDIGTVQDKDATRHRVKMYCGAALFQKYSAACMINVQAKAA